MSTSSPKIVECDAPGPSKRAAKPSLILRLGFGKQQLIVCRINYAMKWSRTGHTMQIVTFKAAFIDVWSDTPTKFEFRVAFGARNNLRAMDQRGFA
jgi:hypothetical protein